MDKMDNGHRGHFKNAFLSPTHFGKEGKQGFAGEAIYLGVILVFVCADVVLYLGGNWRKCQKRVRRSSDCELSIAPFVK